jgi:hypothetical protein
VNRTVRPRKHETASLDESAFHDDAPAAEGQAAEG